MASSIFFGVLEKDLLSTRKYQYNSCKMLISCLFFDNLLTFWLLIWGGGC